MSKAPRLFLATVTQASPLLLLVDGAATATAPDHLPNAGSSFLSVNQRVVCAMVGRQMAVVAVAR